MPTIYYKVIEKKDPRTPNAPGKFYAQIVNTGRVNTQQLCQRIASRVTVQAADIRATLAAFNIVFPQVMKEGRRLKLNQLGTFKAVMNGLGSESPETYETSLISRIRYQFIPCKELKNKLTLSGPNAIKLEKMQFGATTGEDEEEGGGI